MYSILTSANEREIIEINFESTKTDTIPYYLTPGRSSCLYLQFIRNLNSISHERTDYTALMLIGDVGALFAAIQTLLNVILFKILQI